MRDSLSNREPSGDVTRATIGSLGLKKGAAFGYWFDFGDDWWHQVNVVAIEGESPSGDYPRVVKRTGESPPQYVNRDKQKDTMAQKTVTLPRPVKPNIDQVLEEFLAEHRGRLKRATYAIRVRAFDAAGNVSSVVTRKVTLH